MPVSPDPVDTERIELWTRIDNKNHILQFGPFNVNHCNPKLGVPTNGDGTTMGRVTRVSNTEWQILLPAGSIGRLWDYSDPFHPVNKGLYYLSLKANAWIVESPAIP